MMAIIDQFVEVYVLIDDAIQSGALVIDGRPGPAPACSDAEVLTLAVVRHLLARPSERAFLREVQANWPTLFPHLPHQSEFNRRVRWLWGAFEQLRQALLATVPADPWQQIDTTSVPVKHPSRVRGHEWWCGPNGLCASFGRDAAHAEWFFGFRLALRTDLASRLVRAWSVVPAAVDERAVADDLMAGVTCAGLLLDRGFVSRQWEAAYAERGIDVAFAHSHAQRQAWPAKVRQAVAAFRNRIETTNAEITRTLRLDWHGAITCWGLLARCSAILLAHTLLRLASL